MPRSSSRILAPDTTQIAVEGAHGLEQPIFSDLVEGLGKPGGSDSRIYPEGFSCLKEPRQEPSEFLRIIYLAFPNSEDFPPLGMQ